MLILRFGFEGAALTAETARNGRQTRFDIGRVQKGRFEPER
jgi:hypothetical protein